MMLTLAPGAETRPWRVLVAEDNPINMKIAEVTLRRAGMVVIAATTGRLALELARTTSPDIMMLDLSLPDINGLDVARALVGVPFPIVAVTAHVAPEDRKDALDAGMWGFLAKPLDVLALARTLVSLRDAWDHVRCETA